MGTVSSLGSSFGSRRAKVLLFGGALALLVSVLALATLARAQTTECPTRSTLPCEQVKVNPPVALDFSGSEGGLADANGAGTGFTMADPPSSSNYVPANQTATGYDPSKLNVNNGNLTITTTSGIMYKSAGTGGSGAFNQQVNALGGGVDAPSKALRIETSVINPSFKVPGKSEQGGIWFGLNDDNYVKLVVANASASTGTNHVAKIQLVKEVNGASGSTDEINSSSSSAINTSNMRLVLLADPVQDKVTAYYTVGSGNETLLGSLSVPQNLFDGVMLSDNASGPMSFAGVFASHRFGASPVNVTFDDFKVTEADVTAPGVPAGLTASAGTGQVDLDWADNDEGDLRGYNVYRSLNKPVSTSGTPLNGSTPLTTSVFADTTAQMGTNYYYAVRAVDDSGNASAATDPARAMLDDTAPKSIALPFKVNFQSETATVPDGYTRDFGQNYANVRGFGWVEQGTSTPLNLAGNGRDRNDSTVPDQRLDTLMHMQGKDVANFSNIPEYGAWEVALPNGRYDVEVSVGDPSPGLDATSHEINVEGVKAIDDFAVASTTSGDARFEAATVTDVPVNDGKLTIDAIGGKNTKPNYVDVSEAPPADTTAPAVPQNVNAEAGDNRVTLSWSAVGDADLDGYRVYQDGVTEPIGTVAKGETSYTATGLTNGTSYSYSISAFDASGNESDKSGPVTATPEEPADQTAPAVPGGLVATAGEEEVSLSWTANVGDSDLAGYNIYRRSGTGELAKINENGLVPAASYLDTGLTAGTEYAYSVSAVDAAGNESAKSGEATAIPEAKADTQNPSAPGNVQATGGERKIEVAWDAATDNVGVDGYNVYEGENKLNDALIGGTTFAHSGLGDDEEHSYVVEAVDAAGNAARASAVTARTLRAVECPEGVCADKSVALPFGAGFDGTQQGIHDKDREGTGFRLVQASSNGGKYLPENLDVGGGQLKITATPGIQYKVDNGSGPKENALDNGLGARFDAAGGTTRIAVDVVNPPGGTNSSQQAGLWFGPDEDNYVKLVVGSAGADLHKAQIVRELAGASASTDEINGPSADWRASTVRLILEVNASGKAIASYAVGGGAEKSLGELSIPASWFTSASEAGVFATRRNNTEAGDKIYTLDDFSMEELDRTAPAAPTGLEATAGDGTVDLSWAANTGDDDLAGYNVYRDGTKLTASPQNDTSYPDSNLTNGTEYTYAVTAVDESGNESVKAEVKATPTGDNPPPVDDPPAAPQNLGATAGDGRIDLSWGAVSAEDLAGYNIYRNGTKLDQPPQAGTSFGDTGLTNGTEYSYKVTAVDNANNESADSNVVTATPQASQEQPQACAPRSTLGCSEVSVDAPVTLNFDDNGGGGVVDKDGQGTGFTMVDPPSARLTIDGTPSNPEVPGYEPSKLDVASGRLAVTSTKGIMFKNPDTSTGTNSQLNALGSGLDASGKITRLETTVVNPTFPSTGGAEQGGLWFGLNEDNYAKLVVFNQGGGNAKIQLLRERNAVANDNNSDPTLDDQLDSHTGTNGISGLSTQNVKLALVADAAAGTVTGYYQIGTGAETKLGTLAVPASFFEGAQISDGGAEKATFAGIFDTHRNGSTPITLNFENFSVASEVPPADTQAPAAPQNVRATAGDGQVSLAWDANAENDIAGYNVYRGTSDAVDTSGTPLNASLLEQPSYTDSAVENGTTYHYVLQAADTSGNKSGASARVSATPTVPNTGEQFNAKVNFQNAAAQVPTGYVRDYGQPYGQRTDANQGSGHSYGWIDPATKQPLDLSVGGTTGPGNGRDRNTSQPDQRLDTLMHMQADDVIADGKPATFNGVAKEGVWEIAVPNGTYEVTVAVGDSSVTDLVQDPESHAITVEGQSAISSFVPSGAVGTATRHKTASVEVNVTDGKLTVDAQGGTNTKINYVDITSVQTGPDTTAPARPANVLARAGDARVTVTWTENNENDFAGYNIYAGTSATGEPLNGATLLQNEYYIDRNLANGVERSYVVEAADASGNKAAADPVVATPDVGKTEDRPRVVSTSPADAATNVALSTGVAATLNLVAEGVDEGTFSDQTVKLFKVNADGTNGAQVAASYGTSGGNDVINLIPNSKLEANTKYRFEVTDGVEDLNGIPFVPYTSTFTTGTTDVFNPPGVTTGDVGSASFERISQPNVPSKTYTSVTMGPDNKLYAGTISGEIYRFDVAANGDLSNPQTISTIRNNTNDCNTSTISDNGCTNQRLIIGLTFEPGSTAENPRLWVTHSTAGVSNLKDWGGKLSVLSGPDLGSYRDVLVNLPRSSKDHLTNSIAFQNGKMYFPVGATTAMGAYDQAWKGTERLLSAAVIEVDYQNIQGTLDVKTAEGGTYDPYQPTSPVKIYATGVRNAVDLVWHSNGSLYLPTNGSAGGSNVPATPAGVDTAAEWDQIPACKRRGYAGPVIPDFDGDANGVGSMKIPTTQLDYLFRVVRGGYYGNPNPSRCEWVLNLGNPTSAKSPMTSGATAPFAPGEVDEYPAGTQADPNYRGWAYNFNNNQSPNGAIEYKSDNFGGMLKGKLLVVRYSQGDDIVVLEPGANGDIAKHNIGVPGLKKVTGSEDPLDLVEDTRSGNLYVTEGVKNPPDGTGKITLLRAGDAGTRPANISVDKSRLIYNDVSGGAASAAQTVTVKNEGNDDLTISGASLLGENADQFQISAGSTGSVTLTPGQSQQFGVVFNPTSVGPKGASLDIASDDPDTPVAKVNLRGLGTQGLGGSNEPSLQWILDTYEIPVNVGDADPTNNSMPSTSSAIGDEISGVQKMQAAYSDAPVTVEPLAVFGPQHSGGTVTKVGRYVPGSAAGQKSELFTVPNASYQSLNPTTQGSLGFETPDAFGLYSIWPFFGDREVFSEDVLNTWEPTEANRHKVRVYPLKKKDGSVEQNAYIVATEEHTSGYDYQDVVYIIRNAKPAATDAPEVEAPEPGELVFSGVKGTTSAAQSVTISNSGKAPLEISGASPSGTNAGAFQLVNPGSKSVPAGGTTTFDVKFAPGSTTVGSLSAKLTVAGNDADEANVDVGLYGLSTNGEQGSNEPTLQDVVNTLGHPFEVHNLSGNPLTFGTDAGLKGEEVAAPYFRKAGSGSVTIEPVARYSPDEALPFGWYTGATKAEANERTVATIAQGQMQTLNPKIVSGGGDSFDPGSSSFGVFTNSETNFKRKTYQNDSFNVGNSGGVAHAARVYPAENRAGEPLADTYIVSFEDATNGDYQDYVFRVTNVKPSDGATTPTTTDKFNFQPAGSATPQGYTADTGQAFDAARGYGWVQPGTSTPVDMTPNTRERATPSDPLLRTLIIMQGNGGTTQPNKGTWERVVADGTYQVKVGVGDSEFFDGTDGISVEGQEVIPVSQRTSSQTHLNGTAEVTVSDGRLSVVATGTNTKLNFVEVTGEDTTTPPPSETKKINFQPDAAAVPTGYAKDAGLGYDAARGYGWVAPGTQNPVDLSAQSRERNLVSDQRQDTLVIMQPGAGNPGLAAGSWEHALPNGAYEVSLSVGDAGFTNSVHRINVEGVSAINGFTPTDDNKFASATVTVNVTDGRLTVDAAGGDQTKINYVDIISAGSTTPDETAPTVDASVNGTRNDAGAYLKRATLTIEAEDNEGGSGIKSLSYSVNGGEFEAYTAPADFTEAGDYTIVARATDNAGNEATGEEQRFTVVIPPPGRGEIEVENLDGVPFPDRLVFNRIQNPEEGTTPIRDDAGNITGYVPPNTVHDAATLRVTNTGPDLLTVEELRISDTTKFRLDGELPLPAVVKPNESLDIPVRFVYSSTSTTSSLQTGTLTVVSDDTDEAETRVDLAGFWQPQSEGGKEPNFGQIVAAYGYGTSVPQGSDINTKGKLVAQGDEILSPYWLAADASKPVSVRQLAAFHTQGSTASFGWTQKNTYSMTNVLTHVGVDGQSFLPRKNDANRTPGLSTFIAPRNSSNALVPFGFRSAPEHSDYAVNTAQGRAQIDYDQGCVAPCGHHFRTWPALDRSGKPIPNAYLMTMDYAGINYDFQDNVYLVTNIKPENAALDPAAPAPLPGAASLKLEFDKDTPGTLADKNNVGTGFRSTQPNKNDITPGSDSYKKELLEMATAAPGTLAVTTSGTTNGGAINGLVNGLRLPFDGSGGEYTMSTGLVGPLNNLGTGQGGVMFGSDQDNFIKVNAINKNNVPSIEFFVERGGNNSTTSGNGTIGTVAIPNGGNVASLDLYLTADKATGEVRAAYRVDDGALATIPGKVTLSSTQMGRFFAEQAKAGIIAHHGASTNPPVTVEFDRFAITSGAPDPTAEQRNALYRLDTGTSSGAAYTDTTGNAWTSDAGLYTPSTAINEGNNTDAIDNTEDDALYRTYRGNVGNVAQAQRVLTYNLPTNGAEKLDLRLHFAERAWSESGKRLFDIEIEGKAARKNFDIFAAAGGKNTATALTIDDVAVADGSLTLALRASLDYPAISGIEVLCEGTCPDPDKTAPAAPSGLGATPSDAGIALDWDNNRENDVAGYNVYRSGSENGTFTKINSTLVAASQYNDAAAPAGATSFYKVEAVDASGNVSGASVASATRPQSTQAAIRINTGGPAQTVSGVSWKACDATTNCSGYVTGGGKYSENDTITGIPQGMNNAIFQSEWTGGRQNGIPAGGTAFSFNVPVQTGDYKLRLHFAELNKTATGTRVFDVNVEGGAKELTGFDIFKEAGGIDKAIVREFPVNITDGTMNIDFIAQVENAKISAIEILPVAAGDKEAPAAPQNLRATASESGIALDWADNAEADLAGYNVSRSATESGTFTKLNGAPLAASAFNDVGVDAGKTYFYKVTAVDKAGNESDPAADGATMPEATGFTAITWTNTNQNQPQANSEGQSEVVGGKLYSFGGFDSKKPCCSPTARAYSYTPAGGWVRIANMPAQNGTAYGGVTHAGFTTDGEDIFWAGGYTSNGNGTGQIFGTKEVWKYDVSADRYVRLANLPVERAGGQLEYLDGKLYYFGGTNLARTQDVGNLYVLDLANQSAGWTEKAAMPNGRHHLASAVIGGKVYAIGGQKAHDEVLVPQADVHAYDPQADAWTQRASMPRAINHATSSTVVMGGRAIMVGGQTTHGTGVADVNAYDPNADTWTALTPLPVARHSGVAGVLGGNIYFSTGGTNVTLKGVPGADTAAPKVAGVQPAEDATDVKLGVNVQASFNESMDAASLTAQGNFVLEEVAENGDKTPVAASVTTVGNKAILDPDADLQAGMRYAATVKGAVKDMVGNQLGTDKTWTFFTEGYEPPDTTPPDAPTVRLAAASDTGASNSDGVTNAVRPTLEGQTEADSTVEVSDGGVALGTARADGSGAWSFAVPSALADGDHAITATATDAANNVSPASAATKITVDTAAPDTTLAASGPSGTVNSASAEFAFSSENSATFECKLDAGSYAACTSPKSYTGLANGGHTFSVQATDLAGNTDASPAERAWTVDVDSTPPTVQSVSPQVDAVDVAVSDNVTVTFSEAMKETTIDGSTFNLKKGTTSVSAGVAYDAQSKTATLDPSSDLDEGATYTATVTTGAQDAAGNALGSARTWSFTTRQPVDTTPPTVANVSPAAQATDVALGTNVAATFSEAMLASTIDANSFTLVRAADGAPVNAGVSYDATTKVATLDPSSDLDAGKVYTARISTAVKDEAGNTLAGAEAWSFTTKEAPVNTQKPIRIEAGGPGRTVGDVEWSACSSTTSCNGYVKDGFRYKPATTPTITNPVSPASGPVYYQEWTGGQTNGVPKGAVAFSFNVPVESGNYLVRLHFAEIVQNGVGKRLFDVDIEGGAKELSNFDVFAEAGAMNRAIVREFDIAVTDGKMNIDFIRQIENAKVSAIEIVPINGGAPSPDLEAPAAPAGLTANASQSSVALNWADNVEADLAGYNVYRSDSAGGAFTKLNNKLLLGSQYTDPNVAGNTTYHYQVRSVDQFGNESVVSTASAKVPLPTQAPIRINAGGPAQTVGSVKWLGCAAKDKCHDYVKGGFATGKKNPPAISGVVSPANRAIYQREWTGGAKGPTNTIVPKGAVAFSFNVPVQSGTYKVRLHFAEVYQSAAGARLFDVDIEGGAKELSNFDIYKEANGKNKAIVREFDIAVTDGKMNIDFIRQIENAKIDGIEIIPAQ